MKSPEFEVHYSGKALAFFEQGFQVYLDQFRANGYSKAEHPASFLYVYKALEALPEEGDVPGTEEAAGGEAD